MRLALIAALLALPIQAQHDISKVEPAPPGGSIATPMPEPQRRQMKKYDIPDLAGAQQALGSQLIDGRLRKPLIDYLSRDGTIEQRVSIFEGGLVVLDMTGASTMRKKLLIPDDALRQYVEKVSTAALRAIDPSSLPAPEPGRRSVIRAYNADGTWIERQFNPGSVLAKPISDQITPMRDLLRAVSEDRTVTSSVAGYEPKPGDELVADDQKVYRVVRVVDPPGVVELKCLDAPTTMYIAKKDLDQYFIGKRRRD